MSINCRNINFPQWHSLSHSITSNSLTECKVFTKKLASVPHKSCSIFSYWLFFPAWCEERLIFVLNISDWFLITRREEGRKREKRKSQLSPLEEDDERMVTTGCMTNINNCLLAAAVVFRSMCSLDLSVNMASIMYKYL